MRVRLLHITFLALLGAILLLAPTRLAPVAHAQAVATETGIERLEDEIERLAQIAGGEVGVGAIHLETGREIYLNRSEAFPLASTYKVPIAVQLLSRVERGDFGLDSMVTIQPGDLHPGSGTLSELFDDPGVELSLRNLLELMLLISDNSATDLVLRTAGGPARVTERMRELEIEGIRVDRPTVRLIADWIGVRDLPGDDLPPEQFRALADAVSEAEREAAATAFDADPRDTATPAAMARLLAMIGRGEALNPEHTELLLDIMRRSTTGQGRIKGFLPPEVEVAHKTGTIGGTTNDVGIITLPDDAGRVAVALFVKESDEPVETRERAIAQISRAIYDYFLFNPR